jgi:hypothetical protein
MDEASNHRPVAVGADHEVEAFPAASFDRHSDPCWVDLDTHDRRRLTVGLVGHPAAQRAPQHAPVVHRRQAGLAPEHPPLGSRTVAHQPDAL